MPALRSKKFEEGARGDVPHTPRHEWTTSQRRKADQPGKDEPHPRVDREANHADGATLAAKTSRGHRARSTRPENPTLPLGKRRQ